MIDIIRKRWLRLQDFKSRDYRLKAKQQYQQFLMMVNAVTPYAGELKRKRILDIGCGRFYPFTFLLNSLGNNMIGMDICYIGANDPWLKRYWRILKYNGLEKLGEELLYKLSFTDRTYYTTLKRLSVSPLTAEGIVFQQMDVENIRFPDETFDVIISFEVFEHIVNVAQAVSELARVMRKGAVAYIDIHLFTSLSGGHHLLSHNPGKVPPWDHLRQRKLPLTCCLNGLRENEYLRLFRDRLEILQVIDVGKDEGKEFLTAQIRAELSNYSEQELLKQGIVIIARKGVGE